MKKGDLYYWFFKKSGIWRGWYERCLNEFRFDLQWHRDIEQEEIEKKYLDKLKAFRENKNF